MQGRALPIWIATIGLVAAAAGWWLLQTRSGEDPAPRTPMGRLHVICPTEGWSLHAERQTPETGVPVEGGPSTPPTRVTLTGVVSLAPGPYTVVAERTDGELRERERLDVTIEDGAYHVVALRRRLVLVEARRQDDADGLVPFQGEARGGPLWLDVDGANLHLGVRGPTGTLLPETAEVDARAAKLSTRGQDGPWMVLANPFGEALDCAIETEGYLRTYRLPAATAYAARMDVGATAQITATHPDGTVIETFSLAVKSGALLYSIGGATLYAWHGTGIDEAADGQRLLPVRTSPLPLIGARTLTQLQPVDVDPDDSALLRVVGGEGESASLLVRASAPVLPPVRGELRALTHHPELAIAEIALHPSLSGKVPRDVTVRDDSLVGIVDGAAFDLGSGLCLHEEGPPLTSVTATSEGLFFITRDGHAATIREGRLMIGRNLADPSLVPWGLPQIPLVLLLGGVESKVPRWVAGEELRDLLPAGGDFRDRLRPAQEVPERYTAATVAPGRGLLVARQRQIDIYIIGDNLAVTGFASVLQLPPGPDVIALQDLGTAILLSTRDTIYLFQQDAVVPLIDGLGGTLHTWRGGVLVHDTHSHRLFLLSGPPLEPPSGEDPAKADPKK